MCQSPVVTQRAKTRGTGLTRENKSKQGKHPNGTLVRFLVLKRMAECKHLRKKIVAAADLPQLQWRGQLLIGALWGGVHRSVLGAGPGGS